MPSDEITHRTSMVLKSAHGGLSGEQAELEKIRSVSVSALKILVMASMDDTASEEFFSSHDNYAIFVGQLEGIGTVDGAFKCSESVFAEDPFMCWMKVIVVLFTTLYSFPSHNDIECDIITSSEVNGDGKTVPFNELGVYFSTLLRLEQMDWSTHKVDLFIPSNDGGRIMFIIDDEAVMFAKI